MTQSYSVYDFSILKNPSEPAKSLLLAGFGNAWCHDDVVEKHDLAAAKSKGTDRLPVYLGRAHGGSKFSVCWAGRIEASLVNSGLTIHLYTNELYVVIID